MSELELYQIAELVHEYRELVKRNNLSDGERSRLNRVNDILVHTTLSGEQIMEMHQFDPLILGNNDIKRSTIYLELQEEHEKLKAQYDNLNTRHIQIVSKLEEALMPFSTLVDLLRSQDFLKSP